MTIRKRPVSLMELPSQAGEKETRAFLEQMKRCVEVDRPQLVVDCSKVAALGKGEIHLLLCSLEEAMKRNGDVKLAAIPSDGSASQDLAGVHRLFESFDTTADAVNSFHQLPSHAEVDPPPPCTYSDDAARAKLVNSARAR